MANKIIHGDIMSHMQAVDKHGEHYEGDSKTHSYGYFTSGQKRFGQGNTAKELQDHLKSKGWILSNHTEHNSALTSEGEMAGETHRYEARKGDKTIHIHHAIGKNEPGLGKYHEIETNSGKPRSIEKLKSVPTFAQYLQKTGGDKDLAHAAGLMPKNKMN